jgi:phosphoenolpyruvate-protein phosphotransferase
MEILDAKPISPGYARGTAFVLNKAEQPEIPRYSIGPDEIPSEHGCFHEALEKSSEELKELQERLVSELGQAESRIFAAHLALLKDPQFISKVKDRISRNMVNVEHALKEEMDDLTALLSELENEYMRERANDIHDIRDRVLKHLGSAADKKLRSLPPGSVIVAEDLLPSDTLNLDREHVAAVVTERGGTTSHMAVLTRSMGVPAVSGVVNACRRIPDGAEVLVDGVNGKVTIGATESNLNRFVAEKDKYNHIGSQAAQEEQTECITSDGTKVELLANIGRAYEAADVLEHNLAGVGLFRTEYIFMQSSEPPACQTQVRAYQEVAERLAPRPVTIRTLDLGGDKMPQFLAPKFENNPSLGNRGLRFSLMERQLLHTQLEAILRTAENFDNVRILLPMVMGKEDLSRAVEQISSAAEELHMHHTPRIGAMIETPSSVFELDEILQVADFVSIGTNDLAQFMLAADRNSLYLLAENAVLHPSVVRAIRTIVQAAQEYDRPVCVCGEEAGNPPIACLLVGLGIRQLSMSPVRAGRLRYALRRNSCSRLQEIAECALKSESPAKIGAALKENLSLEGQPVTTKDRLR